MGEVRPLSNGLYGRYEGTRIVAEIDPQPSEVIQFHQLCSRLKRNNQRRITYLENSDCYIAEYLGPFPTDVEAGETFSITSINIVNSTQLWSL